MNKLFVSLALLASVCSSYAGQQRAKPMLVGVCSSYASRQTYITDYGNLRAQVRWRNRRAWIPAPSPFSNDDPSENNAIRLKSKRDEYYVLKAMYPELAERFRRDLCEPYPERDCIDDPSEFEEDIRRVRRDMHQMDIREFGNYERSFYYRGKKLRLPAPLIPNDNSSHNNVSRCVYSIQSSGDNLRQTTLDEFSGFGGCSQKCLISSAGWPLPDFSLVDEASCNESPEVRGSWGGAKMLFEEDGSYRLLTPDRKTKFAPLTNGISPLVLDLDS